MTGGLETVLFNLLLQTQTGQAFGSVALTAAAAYGVRVLNRYKRRYDRLPLYTDQVLRMLRRFLEKTDRPGRRAGWLPRTRPKRHDF